MVPWLNFTGYSAYTESGTPMLFPIITCGKFTEHDGILTMPFCVNIAHAAADGYHTSMFINELQKLIDMIELKAQLSSFLPHRKSCFTESGITKKKFADYE